MHGIRQILQNEDPIRIPLRLANKTTVGAIFQFFGNNKRRDGFVLIVRKVQPNQAGAFLSLEMP